MNSLIVLASVLVSCNAGGSYDSKGSHHYDDGGHGGVYGGLGGVGGLGGGGLGGGLGGVLGGGQVLGGGIGGTFGTGLARKYGNCPPPFLNNFRQLGPSCNNDENCHGSQKCCVVMNFPFLLRRCQIPLEYRKPGNCDGPLILFPTRRACNDDTLCPGSGKCCKRFFSGQIDTCTSFEDFPRIFGGAGGLYSPVGGSFGPGGGSYGPVGGSFGPVGGSGAVSPLLPVLPQGSFKKKY